MVDQILDGITRLAAHPAPVGAMAALLRPDMEPVAGRRLAAVAAPRASPGILAAVLAADSSILTRDEVEEIHGLSGVYFQQDLFLAKNDPKNIILLLTLYYYYILYIF